MQTFRKQIDLFLKRQTDSLTNPTSRVLLKELLATQIIKKVLAFYAAEMFKGSGIDPYPQPHESNPLT